MAWRGGGGTEDGRTPRPLRAGGDGGEPAGWADGADAFAAGLAAEDASRDRSRVGWLRRASAEDSTVAGLLADLAERVAPATVSVAGRSFSGTVVAVGDDAVALRMPGATVLVALDALAWVRPAATAGSPSGRARDAGDGAGLRVWLADAAADRARVTAIGCDGQAVAGEVDTVGRDVVVLATATGPVWLAVQSLAAVVVDGSG